MLEFKTFKDLLSPSLIDICNSRRNFEDADKKFEELLSEEIRQFGKDSNDPGNSHSEKGSGEGNEVIFVEGNGPDN